MFVPISQPQNEVLNVKFLCTRFSITSSIACIQAVNGAEFIWTQFGWQSCDCQKRRGSGRLYQGRKKAKTTNILPITDAQGFILASTGLIAGNHNDAYNLKPHLQTAFKSLKRLGLQISGAYFNADKAFDTKAARKTCFNHSLIPNIDENKRNRKGTKRGRKRLFNQEVYKRRFTSERSFAWIDKFRALLLRFDRCDIYFLGAHFIAFTLINLRHVLSH